MESQDDGLTCFFAQLDLEADIHVRRQMQSTDTQASLRALLAKLNKGNADARAKGGCNTGQARLDRVQQGWQAETEGTTVRQASLEIINKQKVQRAQY